MSFIQVCVVLERSEDLVRRLKAKLFDKSHTSYVTALTSEREFLSNHCTPGSRLEKETCEIMPKSSAEV